MVSVPCEIRKNAAHSSPIHSLIKPPNVEALYEWYVTAQNTPDADPSWAIVWPTAVALANYLLQKQNLVQNKSVVELGAGLGVVGLVAAAGCGATSVTLTDREPWALQCAMATAATHPDWQHNVAAALLDWTTVHDNVPQLAQSADVIVASDVLYDGDTIQALAAACRALAKPAGAVLLLADPQTERFTGARDTLQQALDAKSMQIVSLPIPMAGDTTDATTMDGRDHVQRMQEPVVLIQCVLS